MFNSATIWILIPLTALMIPIIAIIAGVFKARYRAQQSSISEEDRERLEELTRAADSLNARVETLESILDAEMPDWRDDYRDQ